MSLDEMLTSVSLLLIIYLLLLLCRLSCEREDQSQCQHQVPDNIIISRHCIFFSWLSLLLISTLRFLGKSTLYTAQIFNDLHFQYSLYGTTVTKCLDKMCHFSYLLNINICSPACLTKNSLQPHLPSEIISLYCHPKSILRFTLSSELFVIAVRSTDRPGVASLPPHPAGSARGPR